MRREFHVGASISKMFVSVNLGTTINVLQQNHERSIRKSGNGFRINGTNAANSQVCFHVKVIVPI